MTRHHLPEVPLHISLLRKEDDIAWLRRRQGAWRGPDDCQTCGGSKKKTRVFRWLARSSVEWQRSDRSSDLNEVVEYDCPCEDQYTLYSNLAFSGVPKLYQTMSVWDMVNEPEQEFLCAQLGNLDASVQAGFGLLLWGPLGTGKTLTAALLAKGAILLGYEVWYSTFAEIINDFAETWDNAELRPYFESKVKKTRLLVIDDLGKETRQTRHGAKLDMVSEFISDCLRVRVQDQLPTYLTSNLSPEDIGAKYGTDVTSLLSERTEIRHYSGTSFRDRAQVRTESEFSQGLMRPVVLEALK